jgi:hypothetical protein
MTELCVASTMFDNNVVVYDYENPYVAKKIFQSHRSELTGMKLIHDGQILISSSKDSNLHSSSSRLHSFAPL